MDKIKVVEIYNTKYSVNTLQEQNLHMNDGKSLNDNSYFQWMQIRESKI